MFVKHALFFLLAATATAACGPDPGNGTPCNGAEDCLPGLSCVPGVGQCLHPCVDCDVSTCITAAQDPGFFCPAPEEPTT